MNLDMSLREYIKMYSLEALSYTFNTGIPQLDYIIGGFAPGIHEIHGKTNSRRSLFVLHIVKQAQKDNLLPCFLDSPAHLSMNILEKVGINPDELVLGRVTSEKDILEMVEEKIIKVLIIDTLVGIKDPGSFIDNLLYTRLKNRERGDVLIILVNNMYSDYKSGTMVPYYRRYVIENCNSVSNIAKVNKSEYGMVLGFDYQGLDYFSTKHSFRLLERDGLFPYEDNLIITGVHMGIIHKSGQYIVLPNGEAITYNDAVYDRIEDIKTIIEDALRVKV